MKMTIEDIKKVAHMEMVKYYDAADRKREGIDQYYINFELEDGGCGSFDESQDINDNIVINY